jgi:hypothetical protein
MPAWVALTTSASRWRSAASASSIARRSVIHAADSTLAACLSESASTRRVIM